VIGSTRQVAVNAYGAPADMRKSFDTLSLLVVEGLGRDVLSGDLFLFVSRNRRRAKVLYWDGTRLCVFAKRLEPEFDKPEYPWGGSPPVFTRVSVGPGPKRPSTRFSLIWLRLRTNM